ncbi:energy transducer TonB [Hymenobacter cellulosilyticus]|uniref:Energy transducer TonB n=1 Tax=Hymenobacter cellulosilyticus TaxID=2932248 RepID=A0A8T9PZS1_9BACT|nr:energy transducer TonB [Hymenobacter cellulosilyticus]UOQ70607.1 energy transducer TonB [Hymenobacter cellulosilyticus]
MKKIPFILALGLLAGTSTAYAQKTKVKVKTDGPVPEAAAPATEAAPAAAAAPAPGRVGKQIPVAEYYEGGQEAMYAFIEKELKYPVMARRNRIQGTCIVSFTLNTDGTMTGHKLVKNIGGGCGEEALRVARLLKFNKPGYAVLTSLPIVFKLSARARRLRPLPSNI